MLFTPMLLAYWLQQLLSCMNHPSCDGSRVLTCFISDSTAAFYLELTHALSTLYNPCIHPVPLCWNEILFSPVVRVVRDLTPVNNPFARNAEHEQGDFRSPPGVFLGVAVDCIRAIPRNLRPRIHPISFPHYVEVYRVKLACSDTNPGCD